MSRSLNLMALSAPHWVQKNVASLDIQSLNSPTPFSLQNAVRLAAQKALNGEGYLGESNWNTTEGLTSSVVLYEYFEESKILFEEKILKQKPNVLLIGSMTLAFPGAIGLAEIAKKHFGDEIIIILGGKHAIETTFLENGMVGTNRNCSLRMMRDGEIPAVFDFVLSGDGEEIIPELMEVIGKSIAKRGALKPHDHIESLLRANGDWLLAWSENETFNYIESHKEEINYDLIKAPFELFGIDSNFNVFDSELTAHMYSYMGKGCPYNCFFCSERRDINGKLVGKKGAVDRLVDQLIKLREYGIEHLGHTNISAFVEDSILLGGGKKLLKELLEKLKKENLYVKFGAQFTLDTLLSNKETIRELAEYGLYYVFLGMETNDEEIAKTMDKNTKRLSWKARNEEVLTFLTEAGIKCGFSILFGLGESQDGRVKHLRQILEWQEKFDSPHVISLNWATLHPLRNKDICEKYLFNEWGIPGWHEDLDLLSQLFGEVSLNYCLPNTKLPKRENLIEILNIFDQVNHQNGNLRCQEVPEL